MTAMITARESGRTQSTRKAAGRKFGPQSIDVAVTEGLIEAIVALVGTERFEAEHERGHAHIIVTRREHRFAYRRDEIAQEEYFDGQERLDKAESRLIIAMRDHRKHLCQRIIPEVQANYRAAEAILHPRGSAA